MRMTITQVKEFFQANIFNYFFESGVILDPDSHLIIGFIHSSMNEISSIYEYMAINFLAVYLLPNPMIVRYHNLSYIWTLTSDS